MTAHRGDQPFLFPHLLKRVGEIKSANLLRVLELKKLVASVASHVHENVAPVVSQEPLAPRHLSTDAIGQETDKILHRHLVPAIVHLDVVAVEIDGTVRVAVDCPGKGVARVAGHVVGEHEDDLGVGDAQPLDGSVYGQDIGEMAVVEPEARRADEDGPVAGVLGEDDGGQQSGHEGREAKVAQLHFGVLER